MKTIQLAWALIAGLAFTGSDPVKSFAQTNPPSAQPLDPLSLQWPRYFTTNGYDFAIYQPQITKWPSNRIEGRFTIATRPIGTSNETYGVAFFAARTEIDKFNRLVTLEDFVITGVKFPTQKTLRPLFQKSVQSELPAAAKIIPLDHLEAVFAASGDIALVKVQKVDNTPPRII